MSINLDSATAEIVEVLESYKSAIADPARDDEHLKAGNHEIGDGIDDVCRRLKAVPGPGAVHARVELEHCSLYLPVVGARDRENNRGILLDKLDRAIKVLNQN